MQVIIYHNPACSKSRAALELLRARGIEPTIVEYLTTPHTEASLCTLLAALALPAIGVVRRSEEAWKNCALREDADESSVIAALLQFPILIERPIVTYGSRAVIGRPIGNIDRLLDKAS